MKKIVPFFDTNVQKKILKWILLTNFLNEKRYL